jgi:hypothetical protein
LDNQYIINPLSLHAILIFSFFSLHFASFRFDRFRFVSFRSVSFRFVWFRFGFFHYVSLRSVSFRFVWFRFVSFGFVSFRFYFVSHFTGTQYQNNQDSVLTIVSGNKLHMNLYRTHWPYMKYHNNPRKGCLNIGQTRFPLQTDMSKLTAGYPLLPLHSCIWNVSQLCPLASIGQ